MNSYVPGHTVLLDEHQDHDPSTLLLSPSESQDAIEHSSAKGRRMDRQLHLLHLLSCMQSP